MIRIILYAKYFLTKFIMGTKEIGYHCKRLSLLTYKRWRSEIKTIEKRGLEDFFSHNRHCPWQIFFQSTTSFKALPHSVLTRRSTSTLIDPITSITSSSIRLCLMHFFYSTPLSWIPTKINCRGSCLGNKGANWNLICCRSTFLETTHLTNP